MNRQQRDTKQLLARMLSLQTAAPEPVRHTEPPPSLDDLTGLPDADLLRRDYARAALHAMRAGEAVCLALVGVEIRDLRGGLPEPARHGPLFATVARRLRASFRMSDLLVRWSGTTLGVLLPATPLAGGVRAVEKSMLALTGAPLMDGYEPFEPVTHAGVVAPQLGAPFQDTIRAAGRCLALARQQGAGCIRWPNGTLDLSSRRTLLVSADPLCLELVRASVGRQDSDLIATSDLASACARARALFPGLVILDLAPDVDAGLRVLAELRSCSASAGVPVVVIGTAREQLPAAFTLGASEFLHRPIWQEELQARLGRLLHRRARLSTCSDPVTAAGSVA